MANDTENDEVREEEEEESGMDASHLCPGLGRLERFCISSGLRMPRDPARTCEVWLE